MLRQASKKGKQRRRVKREYGHTQGKDGTKVERSPNLSGKAPDIALWSHKGVTVTLRCSLHVLPC